MTTGPGAAIPPAIREAVAELPAIVPLERAAAFLGVHEQTMRRWYRSGRVKVLRTGAGGTGKVSILRSEVARLLAGMAQPTSFQS